MNSVYFAPMLQYPVLTTAAPVSWDNAADLCLMGAVYFIFRG